MDLTKLSDDDLMALKSGDLTKLSDAGLMSLKGGGAAPAAPQAASEKRKTLPVQQFMGNIGSGLVRGAGSIGATLLTPYDMLAGNTQSAGNPERRKAMDDGLQSLGFQTDAPEFGVAKSVAEVAGTMGVGGSIANTLGRLPGAARAAPVLESIRTAGMSTGLPAATTRMGQAANMLPRMLGGGVTGAAAAGLVDPNAAGAGGVIGAAAPPALKATGELFRAGGRMLAPNVNNRELASKAINQYGIPLGPADVSGSRGTKALRSVLNDAPLVGGIGERQGERVREGFNRAVGQTFGADAPKLTPDVVDAAKGRMGAEFDRIWNRNNLQFDGDLFGKLQELRQSVAKSPQGEAARLSSWLDDIESKMVQGPNGELSMPGEVANRLQSKLRQDAEKATGFLKSDLEDLRKSVIGAFNRSVTPEDAAALTKNRGQYKAFKTVEPILQKSEVGTGGREVGDVPAALLPEAVRKSYGSRVAGSPFADLSQIGSQYLVDRVARTGGGPRAAIQNSALGSALAFGAFNNPLSLAAVPLAAGTQQLLGSPQVLNALMRASQGNPQLANALMNPAIQQAVLRGAPLTASGQ